MRKCDKEVINRKCRDEWLPLILNWVHNEKDRQMLIRWGLDGISIQDIAEEFGISVNRCQERIEEAKEQLFKNI